MKRKFGIVVLALFLSTTGAVSISRAQQASGGSICVLVYNDTNKNKTHDSSEAAVADVNVDLMAGQSVIVANHVTDGNEPYCFQNLPPRQYTLSVNSPLYIPTTLNVSTFALENGDKVTKEFGVVPGTPPTPAAAASTTNDTLGDVMNVPIRLALSSLGSFIVMLFMGLIGVIIYFAVLRRPAK